MENYTRPNDREHADEPKDWLNGMLIFANAIGHLLQKDTGVVVDIHGAMFNPMGKSEKVIVMNIGEQIGIDNFETDLPAGTICRVA